MKIKSGQVLEVLRPSDMHEAKVYVDKGDGVIEAETRIQPAYGRSVLDDPDVKAAMEAVNQSSYSFMWENPR